MGVVIDSSIFIAAERGKFDWISFHAGLNEEPLYLTAITLAELLHGAARADTAPRKAARLVLIEDIESRFPLLPFARSAAAEYADIWATLSVHGNLIGTHDMQIAAIARHEGHRCRSYLLERVFLYKKRKPPFFPLNYEGRLCCACCAFGQ